VNPEKRLSEFINSSISYRRPFNTNSFDTAVTYREDFKNDRKDIELPTYSFSMPSRPLHEYFPFIPDDVRRGNHWWKNINFGYSNMGAHRGIITDSSPSLSQIIFENTQDDDGKYLSEHHAGIRQNISLSWNTKMYGWLNLNNSLAYQDAIFDRDMLGNQLVHGYFYSTNHRVSFNIYGIRRFVDKPIMAMRHIITPSASFSYNPDFSEKNRHFYRNAVSIPNSTKRRTMNMDLSQRWEFRLRPDANDQPRYINNLLSHRVSTSYYFEREREKWGDFQQSINIDPGSFEIFNVKFAANQNYSATHKTYENFNISTWSVRTGFSFSGEAIYYDYFPIPKNDFMTGNLFPADTLSVMDNQLLTIHELEKLEHPGSWSVNANHNFSYMRNSRRKTQTIRNSLNAKLTQNWSVAYSLNYDLENKFLMNQTMTINRELHCWQINFSYSKAGSFWEYHLVLMNTKLPDSLRLPTRGTSR
jgi:hypothetical protein